MFLAFPDKIDAVYAAGQGLCRAHVHLDLPTSLGPTFLGEQRNNATNACGTHYVVQVLGEKLEYAGAPLRMEMKVDYMKRKKEERQARSIARVGSKFIHHLVSDRSWSHADGMAGSCSMLDCMFCWAEKWVASRAETFKA